MDRTAADGTRRRRRARSTAVGASLLGHLAVLAALGWAIAPLRWRTPPSPPEPVVELRLEAPGVGGGPLAVATPLNPPRPAPPRPLPAAPAEASTASVAPAPVARTPSPPAAAAPAAAAAAAGGAARGSDGSVEGAAPGVRDALRGLLGCAHGGAFDLSPAEKARCGERLGLASRTAPRFDPIPAAKRAYYDAVAAAYARTNAPPGNAPSWSKGAPRGDLLADKGGLTLPLAGCGMRFGIPRGWKSYHDVPPHALKLAQLGPLKCFVPPPAGRGFDESGVEAPASLREQTDDAAHMKALDPPR